jgi:hypothetical protein
MSQITRMESKMGNRDNKLVTIFCVLLILVLGAAAKALAGSSKNPMRRACIRSGATVRVIEIQSTGDEFLFCEYGSSFLDGITVMSWMNDRLERSALRAYRATPEANSNACNENHGTSAIGLDKEGQPVFVCLFSDRSMIEYKTLSKGNKSSDNTGLNQALGF